MHTHDSGDSRPTLQHEQTPRPPEPAPEVGEVLRAVGLPLRELEMRMFAPVNVVMSIAFDEKLGGRPLSEGYRWLAEHFTSVCGETVNLLRDITAPPDAPTRRSRTLREAVEEIRRPEDATLRIRCDGHAFFVEKRRGHCRILQSYIGRYALADSLEGAPVAGVTSILAVDLGASLREIGAHHLDNLRASRAFRTHPEENRLFGGALFSKNDIHEPDLNLHCESTTAVNSAREQRRIVDTQLSRFATAWDGISSFGGTPADWLEANPS